MKGTSRTVTDRSAAAKSRKRCEGIEGEGEGLYTGSGDVMSSGRRVRVEVESFLLSRASLYETSTRLLVMSPRLSRLSMLSE